MTNSESSPIQDILLSIDRVGTFRIILGDQITIGGPGGNTKEGHVSLFAQLSSTHAELRRTSLGCVIVPKQGGVVMEELEELPSNPLTGSSRLISQPSHLTQTNRGRLSTEVAVQVEQPSPLSQTTRIRITPEDRFQERVDGLFFMEHLLLIGPGSKAHIRCPHWSDSGALIFQQGQFRFRGPVGLAPQEEINPIDVPLPFNERIVWNEIGMYLEPTVPSRLESC